MDNDLADFADYTGIKPEVANAWNQSILEHLRDFPELRPNLEFTGTMQRHYARWYDLTVDQQFRQMRKRPIYDGLSDDALMAKAKKLVKKPRASSDWYAMSWTPTGASGVSVNQQYGKDPAKMKEKLRRDVASKWSPVGTDTIKALLDHELGHQLDAMLDLRTNPDVKEIIVGAGTAGEIGETLSRYAATNPVEFIAEAWAEYRNNPSPRDTARKMGDLIRRLYRERTRD